MDDKELIAHLTEASWSLDYPEDLIAVRAAARLTALAEEVARLRGALESARDALKDWGSYAGEYFQQKHGLANDIAAIDAALAPAARKDPS